MASINDVARQAGVSTATVSRTFRTPDLLSRQTRERVLDVAAQLNYQPRGHKVKAGSISATLPAAEALGFLFFVSDHEVSQINEFYAPVIVAAQAEASRFGMHLLLRTAPRYTVPDELPQMFREPLVAGILLVGAALPEVLAFYGRHPIPLVMVDNRDTTDRHDCILSDGFGGALAATRFLLEQGHRRIAFVNDEPTAPSFQDRQRGYLCALWQAGITVLPHWIISTPRRASLEPYLGPLLQTEDRPTALVAANDQNALAVLTACRALGVSVPEQLSVVGFDNAPSGQHSYPTLTTVGVNKMQIGQLAVQQVVSRIGESRAGAGAIAAVHLIVEATLVPRASCAPLEH